MCDGHADGASSFLNYVDGKWLAPKSGKTFENRNPANRDDLIGLFPSSTLDDVDVRGSSR